MMRLTLRMLALLLLTAAAVAFEPLVGSATAFPPIHPDLLLAPLIAAVVMCPGPTAVVWAGLLGLLCDCLTGSCLGPRMAAFSLIAALGSLAGPRAESIVRGSILRVFLLSLGSAAAAESAGAAIQVVVDGCPLAAAPGVAQIIGMSMSTAILMSAACLVARWMMSSFSPRRSDAEHVVSIGWQRSAD